MATSVTTPSRTSSANATATLEMSSNRRLAILWNAVSGASGNGTRTALISSPASRTLRRYPVKYWSNGTTRSPFGPTSTTDARSASSAGGASPIGEPVPRLPPIVAPLRISRDANCGHSASSSGTRPSSSRSASDRVSAAPISTWSSVTANVRSSVSRSTVMTNGARTPRMLTSTPQSVQPATTIASGCSASSASASARSVGRANRLTRVGGAAGAGAATRPASASSAGGLPKA